MTFVVGVDGGGTHTRAVVLGRDGSELGRAEVAGSVVTAGAPEAAARAVVRAVHAAAAEAGVQLPASVLWAGLAGAGQEVARRSVEAVLVEAGLGEDVCVGTDAEAAFHDAFANGCGILLIAGTGSIGYGRGEDGHLVRVGGWGQRIGDEGSGHAVGSAALRAVVRAEDGRGIRTDLTGAVLEQCGVARVSGLVAWAETASKAEVAALVPCVARAARVGDPVAVAVLKGAVAALDEHVVALLRKIGPTRGPPPLVLWGGLLTEGGPLRDDLLAVLSGKPVTLQLGPVDAPVGAARLALARL